MKMDTKYMRLIKSLDDLCFHIGIAFSKSFGLSTYPHPKATDQSVAFSIPQTQRQEAHIILNTIVKGLLQWLYGQFWEVGEHIMDSLLSVFHMDLAYFESAMPVSTTILNIMFGVGWALLLGNFVFQAARSMMSGLGFEADDPKVLGLRTLVFAFLLVCSRQICEIGLSLGARVVTLLQIPDSVSLPSLSETMFRIDASWLLVLIMGIIIIIQLVRFFLEIGERYVILGVLTILSPLAFAMGGSRSTSDIFKGWARMYASMCLMMVLNVVFVKLIVSAVAIRPSASTAIPWFILIIALARTARKIDNIIARIGLNPAVTGDGLGRGFPGMMALMVGRSLVSGVINSRAAAAVAKAAAGSAYHSASAPSSGFGSRAHAASSPVNTSSSNNSNVNASTASGNTPYNPPVSGMGDRAPHTGGMPTAGSIHSQQFTSTHNPGMAGKASAPNTAPVSTERGQQTGRPVTSASAQSQHGATQSGKGRQPVSPVASVNPPIQRNADSPYLFAQRAEPGRQPQTGGNTASPPIDTSKPIQTAQQPSSERQPTERSQRSHAAASHSAAVHNNNLSPIQVSSHGQATQQGASVQSDGQLVQSDSKSQMSVQSSQQSAQTSGSPALHQNSPSPVPVSSSSAATKQQAPVAKQTGQTPASIASTRNTSASKSPAAKANQSPQSKSIQPQTITGKKAEKPNTPQRSQQPVQGKQRGAKVTQKQEPIDAGINFQKQINPEPADKPETGENLNE
jgi:hypothetical protein